jgi:hypothetical protein
MNVRRIAGSAVALAITGSVALLLSPSAQAATTVSGQLSLSGIATADSPLGGQVVGLHPGDSLVLSASTAPTAGLDKLGLGGLVDSLLGGATGYQVIAHFPAGFPGGKRDVTLGKNGQASVKFTFPAAGTYGFTWNANSITVLGVGKPIKLNGNQLAQAGIALNAEGQWVGKVVVATDPPAGGISLQGPGVSIAPSLPIVGTLPPVHLPGTTLPAPPNPPTPPGASFGNGGKADGGTTTAPPRLNYTPNGPSVADLTMPKGYGGGTGLAGTYVPPGLDGAASGAALGSNQGAASNGKAGSARNQTAKNAKAAPTVDLASSPERSAASGLPALLVVLAVIALSAATAGYARTLLPPRPAHAKAVRTAKAAGARGRH